MISTTNINEARNLIQKLNNAAQSGAGGRGAGRWGESATNQAAPIIIQAQNDEFNRKILDYGKFDILLFPDAEKRKDKLKQLDSGLNHVLAKIAAKNKIAIGYDLEKIRSLEKKEKAIQLARLIQNIKILRKAKTKLALINYKEKKDAFDFLISLGAATQQAKEATLL